MDWSAAGAALTVFTLICSALGLYMRGQVAEVRVLMGEMKESIRDDSRRNLDAMRKELIEPLVVQLRDTEKEVAALKAGERFFTERFEHHANRFQQIESRLSKSHPPSDD